MGGKRVINAKVWTKTDHFGIKKDVTKRLGIKKDVYKRNDIKKDVTKRLGIKKDVNKRNDIKKDVTKRLVSVGTSESDVERINSMHKFLVHERMTNISPENLLARLRMRALSHSTRATERSQDGDDRSW